MRVFASGAFFACLCEEPAGDEAISGHYATDGQIAAAFGLAMTFLGRVRNDSVIIRHAMTQYTDIMVTGKTNRDKYCRLASLHQYLVGAPGRFAASCRSHINNVRIGWKAHWKEYLVQSIAATIVVFIIFFAVTPDRPVIVASIGASTFIVFAMPNNHTAQPKRVVGGHIIGILCGSLFSFFPQTAILPSIAVYSIAVGLSIFLMVALNLEHPPASGTALGIALNGFSFDVAIAVLLSAIVLSIAHFLLCRRFNDLII